MGPTISHGGKRAISVMPSTDQVRSLFLTKDSKEHLELDQAEVDLSSSRRIQMILSVWMSSWILPREPLPVKEAMMMIVERMTGTVAAETGRGGKIMTESKINQEHFFLRFKL